jgi:hypothetical protein
MIPSFAISGSFSAQPCKHDMITNFQHYSFTVWMAGHFFVKSTKALEGKLAWVIQNMMDQTASRLSNRASSENTSMYMSGRMLYLSRIFNNLLISLLPGGSSSTEQMLRDKRNNLRSRDNNLRSQSSSSTCSVHYNSSSCHSRSSPCSSRDRHRSKSHHSRRSCGRGGCKNSSNSSSSQGCKSCVSGSCPIRSRCRTGTAATTPAPAATTAAASATPGAATAAAAASKVAAAAATPDYYYFYHYYHYYYVEDT